MLAISLTAVLFIGMLPASVVRASAQTIPPPRIVGVATVPEAPAFGQLFRIEVTLRVAPGTSVEMPDTLIPAANTGSVGPGELRTTPAEGDSLDVTGSYPVIAFLVGPVALPRLEAKLRRVDGPAALASAANRAELAAEAEVRVLSLGALEIAEYTPFAEADSGTVFLPRPPADVLGGDWSPGFRIALALTVLAAAAVVASAGRRLWVGRSAAGRDRNAREAALRELDRLRGAGLHREGRVDEFYDATTNVLRVFASRVDRAWVPALTSGELISRIEKRWGVRAKPLLPVVTTAEKVKFGLLRPTADEAEADWQVVREWIRGVQGV